MESHTASGKTTAIQELDAALTACRFGKFHIKLLFVSFIGIVASVVVTHTTSYLLTSAECDLNMSLVDKGFLNAAPYLGSLFSSVVTGFLTDTFGRKKFLKFSYGGIFIFTILAGTSQNFQMLLTAKFFEGVCFATSLIAVVAFASEFCHNGIRDRVVVCHAAFSSLAQIISTGIAWAVLTQEWHTVLFNGKFVLNTWNFYLFATSLWSLSASLLFSTLPESPKYLLSQNQYAEARASLLKVYETNHGKDIEKCPFHNIWESNIKEDLITPKDVHSLKHQILLSLRNVKMNFQKSLLILLFTLCLLFFLIMAKYNSLRLWFPQLSTIVEHTGMHGDQDLCVLLDNYTRELKLRSSNVRTDDDCIPNTHPVFCNDVCENWHTSRKYIIPYTPRHEMCDTFLYYGWNYGFCNPDRAGVANEELEKELNKIFKSYRDNKKSKTNVFF